jgi:hypothetical protein
VTLDGFAARLEVVPFPSVVVASFPCAQESSEGHESTRAVNAPENEARLQPLRQAVNSEADHEPKARHAREGHELTRAKPTRKKRNTASAAAKNGRSRTENSKARHAREGHEFNRAVKPEKMKPGFSR